MTINLNRPVDYATHHGAGPHIDPTTRGTYRALRTRGTITATLTAAVRTSAITHISDRTTAHTLTSTYRALRTRASQVNAESRALATHTQPTT